MGDSFRHDIGLAVPHASATWRTAACFSDGARSQPLALCGLETLAQDELSQLRAARPARRPEAAIDPVACSIDWDLAVDGLSLTG